MRKSIKNEKKHNHKVLKAIGLSMIVVYFSLLILFITFNLYYSDKIFPNVYINGVNYGSKKPEDAITEIMQDYSDISPLTLSIGDDYSAVIKTEDIGFRILYVESIKEAFKVGREKGLINFISDLFLAFNTGIQIEPKYDYDELALDNYISYLKADALDVLKEPAFKYSEGEVIIEAGKTGETIDDVKLKEQILSAFKENSKSDVYSEVFIKEPELTVEDLDVLLPQINSILEKDIVLYYEYSKWPISDEELLSFLKPKKNDEEIILTLENPNLIRKLDEIALELNRNPRGQVLEVENGKAVQFVSSLTGLRLKIKESTDLLEESIFNGNNEIELAVEVTTPPPSDNDFGIEEILGVGESKYKGSDSGRKHNVATASEKINGVMVPPGGIFSFNEAVGPINKSTGFTTAWVISKGRTVLGDGGGVCQVSTTVFRTALDAGLPILERNAHSYRVGYYEQDSAPGLDATIYSPSVDLKFKNDTEGYILLSTNVDEENTALRFIIYGKSDGRTVEMTEPKFISQTAPPGARYIDDPSLSKGVVKQAEYPVWGARVAFDRIVKKGDEILYDDTFTSNYRSWGALYRVGTGGE